MTRAVLQEHGHLLMVSGAIENLKKVASYDVLFSFDSGADWNFYDCLGIDALGSPILL